MKMEQKDFKRSLNPEQHSEDKKKGNLQSLLPSLKLKKDSENFNHSILPPIVTKTPV